MPTGQPRLLIVEPNRSALPCWPGGWARRAIGSSPAKCRATRSRNCSARRSTWSLPNCSMAPVSGVELTRADPRRHGAWKDTPIILITGRSRQRAARSTALAPAPTTWSPSRSISKCLLARIARRHRAGAVDQGLARRQCGARRAGRHPGDRTGRNPRSAGSKAKPSGCASQQLVEPQPRAGSDNSRIFGRKVVAVAAPWRDWR